MTRGPGTPYADPTRCPGCAAPVTGRDVCQECGLVLTGPQAARLFGLLSEADAVLGGMERRPREGVGDEPVLPWSTPGAAPGSASGDDTVGRNDGSRRRRLPSLSVPVVLLGVGALLVTVAVVVFGAVTWFLLPELGRGLVLLLVALVAALAATTTTRRGLPVAAEVLWPLAFLVAHVGLVVLGAGLGTAGDPWWLAVTLSLGAVAVTVAVQLRRRGLRPAASLQVTVLVLGVLASYGWWERSPVATELVTPEVVVPMLGSGVVALVGLRARLGLLLTGAIVATVAWWAALVLVGLVEVLDAPGASLARHGDLTLAVGTAALVAVVASRVGRRGHPGGRAAALERWATTAAAASATLLAVATAYGLDGWAPAWHPATLTLAPALVVMAWCGRPTADGAGTVAPWRDGLRWAWGGWTVAAALVVVLATIERLDRVGQTGVGPSVPGSPQQVLWALPVLLVAGILGIVLVAPATRTPALVAAPGLVATSVALHVVAPQAGVVAVVAVAALGTVLTGWALLGVVSGRLIQVPAGGPGALLAVLGLVAATVTGLVAASSDRWPLAGMLLVTAVVAAALCLVPDHHEGGMEAPPGSTGRAVGRPDGLTAGQRSRLVASAVAGATLGGAAFVASTATGRPWPPVLAVVAAGSWVLLVTLLRRTVMVRAAAGVAAVALVVVAAAGQPYGADTAWVLLAGGVVAVLATLAAPEEDGASWVGSVLLLLETLVRLDTGAPAPEVLSLVAGAVLVVIGLWQLRLRPGASSSRLLSPGLTLALLPSLLLALEDPVSVRGAVLLVVAATTVAAGAAAGYAAPLLAGAGCLVLLAVRLLGPVNSVLPFWVLPGVVGTAMILLGVTWESRRAEIGAATRYVRSLR